MSEAASGNTSQPHHPHLSRRERALLITVAASILWAITGALVVLDLTFDGRIPDPIPNVVGMLAVLVSILAMRAWTRLADEEALGALAAKDEEALGALAAKMEQISAKVVAADTAFEYGRRYADTSAGPRLVRGEG